MAEINLEKRKAGMGWLWILIVLVLALIVWWIWADNEDVALFGTSGVVALSVPTKAPAALVEWKGPLPTAGHPLV
ncbi:MAG: hypothetical protein ACRD21_12385 [Vicinamibacteria bacterium]